MKITAQFFQETADGQEVSITVEATFIEGAPAAVDRYGRATECDTNDEWEFESFNIDGKEFDMTTETANLFEFYNSSTSKWNPMTLEQLEDMCIDFLIAERDSVDSYSYLPF